MKLRPIYMCLLFLIVTMAIIALASHFPASEAEIATRYVQSLGYTVAHGVDEVRPLTIPADFNDTYTNYNLLQQYANYNLAPYKGLYCTQYTFIIISPPPLVGMKINIILLKRKIIGGDISTGKNDGLLFPLCEVDILLEEVNQWQHN